MVGFAGELLNVLDSHWYYALVILLCLVVLIAWAIYQLSNSLYIAFAVVIGTLLMTALTLYNQMRIVSSVSLVLAIAVALFHVVSQWLGNNKTVKEGAYDVEKK